MQRKQLEKLKGLHHARSIVPHDASIPTKYQTVVFDNSDKKGFNSQSRRFNYNYDLTDVPGPGRYKMKKGFERCSASYSKKGTGSFASTSSRVARRPLSNNIGPDACTYTLPTFLSNNNKNQSTNGTSSFASPIANMRGDYLARKNFFAPAPNTYFQNLTQMKRNEKNFPHKPFNSTGKRISSSNSKIIKNPSPCHYNIRESTTKCKSPILTSMFASTTKRSHFVTNSNLPGPADYRPEQPVTEVPNKLIMPRKHYLAISAPAIKLPENVRKEIPGPGHYQLVQNNQNKKMTSAFVSNTSRWTQGHENSPGPAKYAVAVKSKRDSFMFNVHKRWV